MTDRIADLVITFGVLIFVLFNAKKRFNWYLLLFIWIILNASFNTILILRSFGDIQMDVHYLNLFSRAIKWYSLATGLYYAIKGNRYICALNKAAEKLKGK